MITKVVTYRAAYLNDVEIDLCEKHAEQDAPTGIPLGGALVGAHYGVCSACVMEQRLDTSIAPYHRKGSWPLRQD